MSNPSGVIAAAVTAFKDDYTLDVERTQQHLDYLIGSGVHGLLVLGGTGENLTLDATEKETLMRAAVEVAARRVPVYAGVFDPGLPDALSTARIAVRSGISGLVVLPPYYIKPSFPGVIEHFRAVARVSDLPLIVYNNPGRVGWNMTAENLVTLSESVPGMVGVKDCERDVAALSSKIDALGNRAALLSGDDDLGFATLLSGAPGGIWTSPNIAPTLCVRLYRACRDGDLAVALALHRRLRDLMNAFFIANHPGPLKELMGMAGIGVGPARPPLHPMTEPERARVRIALETFLNDD